MAKYFGTETAHGFLHDMSGSTVFFAALLLLFSIHKLLNQYEFFKPR
jgi:hypothetical protein